MGILRLGERLRTRLFVRVDPFARFVSCLIYVPREHYNTDQRERMQAVLMEAFKGSRRPSSTCSSRTRRWRAS